jgi:DNA polymerase delta subunit 1
MKMEREGFTFSSFNLSPVAKSNIYGFKASGNQNYLKLSFVNQLALNSCKRILENGFSFSIYPEVKYETYESNIPLILKFMVDLNIYGMNWLEVETKNIKETVDGSDIIVFSTSYLNIKSHLPTNLWGKMAPIKTMSFDIECSSTKNTFPKPEFDPVIAIACITKVFGREDLIEKKIFCLRTCSPIPGSSIDTFDDELLLLEAFSRYIQNIDPDVIIGYNILNFDFPYLFNRALVLGSRSFHYLGRLKGKN